MGVDDDGCFDFYPKMARMHVIISSAKLGWEENPISD
jgi:hypothetical protein